MTEVVRLTARIAERTADVANSELSSADVDAVRTLFLDNFIVSLWGLTRPAVRELSAWTERFAGSGQSRVLGSPWQTEPSTAALVHGMAGHAYELDDTHDVTTSHPGCVIIAAALAVGAESGASQAELFRAVAAGYEAMILIGTASGGLDTVHRGFHPTAVYGTFGAAAAAVALTAYRDERPVKPEELVAAWGHALSQASGSMQFSVEPTGGEVKRLHAGLAARNGINAAEFAALAEVTAPLHAVEGAYGVAASFGGALREVTISPGLQIHTISFKPYSCCRLFHSTIDALREVTHGFSVPVDEIEEILVQGPRLIAEQHMTVAASTMTAQYSCPYIVGATLAYGPNRYDAYGEAFLDDPMILAIAGKVRFEIDPDLEEAWFPDHFATRVTMRFRSGEVADALVIDSVGTLEHPMGVDQLIQKGEALSVQPGFPTGEQLRDVIWRPDSDARALSRALMESVGAKAAPGRGD